MTDKHDRDMNELFALVYDQTSSEDQIAELDHWLRDNPQGQIEYIEFMDLQHELERRCVPAVLDDGWRLPGDVQLSPSSVGFPMHRPGTRLVWSAIAASLIGVCGMMLWLRRETDQPAAKVVAAVSDDAEAANRRDRTLGIITAMNGADIVSGGRQLSSGSRLGLDEVLLRTGRTKVRLESGVEMSIAGPARFQIRNTQLVELFSGAMTADVPEAVIGFSIKMPGLNVVDLGTTFGVSVPDKGKPRIHVFDGVVDAESDSSDAKVRLTESQTMEFNGGVFAVAPFQPQQFVRPKPQETGVESVSGDVWLLETPPRSVELGRFEHDRILCFRETAMPQVLNKDIQVSIVEPGSYFFDWDWVDEGHVPSGSSVDSYYVHLDGIGSEKKYREGSVTFDRPVLGIVLSRKLLKQQDAMFGHPLTIYPDRPDATHDQTLENEQVTLSADRKTIRFRWKVSSMADQIRVFVGDSGTVSGSMTQ